MPLGMPKQPAISCQKHIVLLFNKKQSFINKFSIRLVCKYKKVPIHPKSSSMSSFRGKTARSISREMSFFWYFLVFSSSLNTVFFLVWYSGYILLIMIWKSTLCLRDGSTYSLYFLGYCDFIFLMVCRFVDGFLVSILTSNIENIFSIKTS